jgi:hypothetical protein
MGRNRSGAHHPDDPDRRRILHSTDPSQVSGSISSPRTQKSNDLGLKLLCHQKTPFNLVAIKFEIRILKHPMLKAESSKQLLFLSTLNFEL